MGGQADEDVDLESDQGLESAAGLKENKKLEL